MSQLDGDVFRVGTWMAIALAFSVTACAPLSSTPTANSPPAVATAAGGAASAITSWKKVPWAQACSVGQPKVPVELIRDPGFVKATVRVKVEILPSGELRNPVVDSSSGYPAWDAAVIDTFKDARCQFEPPLKETISAVQSFTFQKDTAR